ncbi:MAG: glutamate--tRNA ligase [Candidatus Aenigmatarchaeota archaeon]
MRDVIKKHALLNAVEYDGKANVQAVIGKVLSERPELKSEIAKLGKEVSLIVKEINSWPLEKQKEELEKFGKIEKPKKEEREGLPPLPNAEIGKVVTRFPPFPSGALHLGNMKAVIISYEYAKMYKGKFIVRIEDTDPDPEKVRKENVDLIKKDLKAMGIKPDKFYFCSSQFPKQYRYAEKLIKEGKAYVCTCKAVTGTKDKLAVAKEACKHRENSIEENLKLWKKMFKEFKEGEAVLRLKTDINDPNPALRDPVLFRIRDGINPTTGKRHKVYPTYNFNCAVEDHDSGVTHILRGTEHATNTEIQKKIYESMGWSNFPTTINFGFLHLPGEKIHKRFIRDAIKQGKFEGWDDPKLGQYGLIRALLRRGIKPEAIKSMIIEMGVNPQTVHFEWEKLYTENRKIIDSISNRYFFVSEPVEITLDKVIKKTVKAPLFPGKRKYRKIPVTKKIFVEKIDFTQYRGKEIRLMHFCNIILDKKAKVTSKELKDIPKIHWVSNKNIKIKIIMPDGNEVKGLAEPEVKKVKPGEIVQFERIGFARCDKKGLFYFAHK